MADAKPPITSPYGTTQSEQEFLSATLRMARLYYDRYPDILDWANVEGKTALHVAALKGKEELVRVGTCTCRGVLTPDATIDALRFWSRCRSGRQRGQHALALVSGTTVLGRQCLNCMTVQAPGVI